MLRIFIIVLAFSMSHCTLGRKKNDSKNQVKAKTWPEFMSEKLAGDEEYSRAWGLFSSSGFADRGQIMILTNSDRSSGEAYLVPATKREVETQRALTKAELSRLDKIVKNSASLKDYESNSFDGIKYHFLRLEKTKGSIKTTQSIKMNNPGIIEPKPESHIKLVEGFHALL